MTRVYRILRKLYAKSPFDGEGAFRYGGRWSSPGTRLAHASEHLSLAMLEYYVHIDPGDPPRDLVVASADIPDSVSRVRLASKDLPAHWRATPPPEACASLGDAFAREAHTCVLIVPSALAPRESNWLINPAHPHFRRIRMNAPEAFDFDSRFYR